MTDAPTLRVGFIGLGSQGGPMARKIAEAGYPTTLWARRPEALEPFADSGAVFAATPAELAATSELICVCVVNDDDVTEVIEAMLSAVTAGSTVVVHSTIHPATCEALAVRLAEQGASLIDAPVSGGGVSAAAGSLTVMVGGTEGELERARPVFATYGDPVLHVGPRGAALLAKLINNALMMAQVTLADDALTLADAIGVDRAALTTIVTNGSGNSFAFGVLTGMGSIDVFADLAADLLRKDVDILTDVVGRQGSEAGDLINVAEHGLGRTRR